MLNLIEVRTEVTGLLDQTSTLLSGAGAVLGREEHYCQLSRQIENERQKVVNLELRLSIVAPMKAGKTTIVNAILGRGILPTRNSAMTSIPSEIVRDQSLSEPVLRLHPATLERFHDTWRRLHREIKRQGVGRLLEKTSEYPELQSVVERIAREPALLVEPETCGLAPVRDTLLVLNDICRLASNLITDQSPLALGGPSEVPRLLTPFLSGREDGADAGSLVIVDTPGPNEARQHQILEKVLAEVLTNTSLVLLVLDYTQLNTQAAELVSREVQRVVSLVGEENLFVLVNKKDARDEKGMTTEEVRRFVSGHLRLAHPAANDRVFEVSAKQAFCAADFLRDLSMLSSRRGTSDYEELVRMLPSARELAPHIFGATSWEEDMIDVPSTKLEGRAKRLWDLSGFNEFLSQAIEAMMRDVAPRCISVALKVARAHLVTLRNDAKLRRKAIAADAEILEGEVERLGAEMMALEKCRRALDGRMRRAQDELRSDFDKTRRRLQDWAGFDVKDFFRRSEQDRAGFLGWVRQMGRWMLGFPSERLDQRTPDHEFETEQEARTFASLAVSYAIDRVRPDVERALAQADRRIESSRRELEQVIRNETQPILDRAKERLRRQFDVHLEIPSPDLGNPLAEVTASETLSTRLPGGYETHVRYERRWYTLWLWPHEVRYTVKKEDRFKVSLTDVATEVNESIRRNLDHTSRRFSDFLELQFRDHVDRYFHQLRTYLEFYRESILKAQEDQRLSLTERQRAEGQLGRAETESSDLIRRAERLQRIIMAPLGDAGSNTSLEVFFSYAREDAELRDRLERHLAQLKRDGFIRTWHDREIGPGREWRGEIDRHLATADVIFMLVSADFLASDYLHDVEVGQALARHAEGSARVIPIVLRECDWKESPLGVLNALPQGGMPVVKWEDQDDAFVQVANALREIIGEVRAHAHP